MKDHFRETTKLKNLHGQLWMSAELNLNCAPEHDVKLLILSYLQRKGREHSKREIRSMESSLDCCY